MIAICGWENYHLIGNEFDDNFSGKPANKDILVNLQKLLNLMKLAKIIRYTWLKARREEEE
ncbi:MAG: hypothetical protein F6K22_39740 [Okeania sp. SIO2F4]|uniref:hypothetical protein n=1 Tax=Okeania sp. SIO2F4 TaxID=2607790 RepID=UPI00142A7853|nr:hypothetical protein [Okeania sp. SIO2F4]NES08349.1 hypothetical protein [Okeania sp. SIO2F4]